MRWARSRAGLLAPADWHGPIAPIGGGAIVAAPRGRWPDYGMIAAATESTITTHTLNGSGHKSAFAVQVPVSGNLDALAFLTGAVTAATDTQLRAETLSTSDGNPTGTLLATGAEGTVAAASITANAWITAVLDTAVAVTRGQFFAGVAAPSGTPNYQIAARLVRYGTEFPYTLQFTTSWAKSANAPIGAVRIGGVWRPVRLLFPITSHPFVAFANNSTPDERAMRFVLDAPKRVIGGGLHGQLTQDCDVVIYDASNNVVATVSKPAQFRTGTQDSPYHYRFEAPVTLAAGVVYRYALKPTTVNSVRVKEFTLPSNAYLGAMPGGAEVYLSTRTDGGSWTDDDTRVPIMWLEEDGADDGAGGATVVLPRRQTYFA